MSVEYITTQRELHAICASMIGSSAVSFDIETQGIDPYTSKVLLLAFTWKDASGIERSAVVRRHGLDLSPVKKILESGKIPKLIHNAKFEYKMMLQQEGISINRMYCTFLAEKVLNSGRVDGFALDDLVKRYLDIDMPKDLQKSFIGMAEDAEFTDEQIQYAADDTLYLLTIFDTQMEGLRGYDLLPILKMELSLVKPIARMELEGLHIDTEKWRRHLTEIARKRAQIEPLVKNVLSPILRDHYYRKFVVAQGRYLQDVRRAASGELREYRDTIIAKRSQRQQAEFDAQWIDVTEGRKECEDVSLLPRTVLTRIHKYVQPTEMKKLWAKLQEVDENGINLNSYLQLIEVYRLSEVHLGISGQPEWIARRQELSTNEEAMEAAITFMRGNPKFSKLLEATENLMKLRALDKQLSTFGDKLLSTINPVTDNIHPDFNQYGAETGRLSASNPNVMNIPKHGDLKAYRSFFIAKPSFTIVKADYCFTGDTLIDTPSGSVPIKDIRVGDLVYTYRNRRAAVGKVTQQLSVGIQPVVEVEISNGNKITCTAEHKFMVIRSNGKRGTCVEDVRAGDLIPGDRLLPIKRAKGRRTGRNCRVVRVTPQHVHQEVFSIAVDPDHNYALAAGVFVRNSQIEVRIAAHISEDPNLLEAYRTGKDVHSYTASLVTGMLYDEIEVRRRTDPKIDDIRSSAKIVMFGLAYAMTEHGLARKTGMTLRDAKEFRDAFIERYSVLTQTLDNLGNDGIEYGYSKTLAGRIRWFNLPPPDIDNREYISIMNSIYRQARNMPIQGTSADMIKVAVPVIENLIAPLGGKVVNLVHDEIVTTAPAKHADQVAEIVKSTMIDAGRRWVTKVPIEVEVTIGNSWGG